MSKYFWPKTNQEILDETVRGEFSKCMEKLNKSNSSDGRFSRAEVYTSFLDGITVGMNLTKSVYSETKD